jgi:hypothetical protein
LEEIAQLTGLPLEYLILLTDALSSMGKMIGDYFFKMLIAIWIYQKFPGFSQVTPS